MNIIRLEMRRVDKQENVSYADLQLAQEEMYQLMNKEYENYSFERILENIRY